MWESWPWQKQLTRQDDAIVTIMTPIVLRHTTEHYCPSKDILVCLGALQDVARKQLQDESNER